MSSTADQLSLVLIRRLADGTNEWIDLEVPQRIPAAPGAAYALIDRTDYEAPQTLVVTRQGEDLIVEVSDAQVLVLGGFFATLDATFHPTTDVASGAGPFSGSPITPDTPILATGEGQQVVWSAQPIDQTPPIATIDQPDPAGGGNTPMILGGLAAGGLGLALLGGGGGGGGGGSSLPADTTAPRVTSGPDAPAIDENSGSGQIVYTATATDASAISWSLAASGDSAAFNINPSTGAVTLISNPDFESQPSYAFTVVATDAAGNSSQQAVSLAINDILDETAPIITSGNTATAIDENSGAGQEVYTATGTDEGPVTWSLAATGNGAAFSIDANTGAVTLTNNPDFETQPSYAFTVVATDETGNSSQLAVSLAINNLDDSAPFITSGATADIDENTGTDQVVYTASATDDGTVTWSLTNTGDSAAFSIDANSGAVTLTDDPDFETRSSYAFTVVATDDVGNSSQQAVTLTINDIDENDPIITSGGTAAAIDESSGAGQEVYTASATDESPLAWSLAASGDADAFSIDVDSGAVTLINNPDFETQSSYDFTVVATDAAGNNSQQAVSLEIIDQDDSAPFINSGAIAAAIDENSGASQAIYTATAIDDGTVTWSLANTGNGAAFSVNANSGVVTLTGDPDFETNPSYTFTVVATDDSGNSSQQAVTLAINDLDENDPNITSPSTADLDENGGTNQLVYTAVATDESPLAWSLGSGNNNSAFNINASNGQVRLIAEPDFETQSSYIFNVVATDTAGNSSQQAVSLAINDLDENDPVITSGGTASALDENSGTNQLVYTAAATDESTVTWSLGNGGDNNAFSINASNGQVRLSGDPDFETDPSYTFTVIATDSAGNSSQQAVSLAINDLDDTAPNITSPSTASALDENSGTNQLVYTAAATDEGTVTWSLANGGDNNAFSINASNGQVRLSGDPDFETDPSYTFTVIATDNAGNSSQQAVSLAINDLDENDPVITSGGTATALDENSGTNQLVYAATATDESTLTWSLGNGPDNNAFNINPNSGAVTLTADPNFETKPSYTFTVIATDSAGNSSQQAVSLAINDLDENDPVITSGGTATALDENSGTNQLVYTAAATDESTLTWSLGNGGDNNAFSINPNSGAVTLDANPDFETKPSFAFTVLATDSAGNSSQQAVTLAINDLDDSAPIITSGGTADINENVGTNQEVYDANATDTGTVTWTLANTGDVDDFSIDENTGVVTLDANPDFETKSSYAFTVVATDDDNNSSQQAVTLAINDLDEIAPALTSSTPADEATAILVGTDVVLNFNENVLAGTGNITISDGSDTRTININDGSQVGISGSQVTIDPTTDLNAGSTYNVQIASGALTDSAGNDYAGINNSTTLNFDTEPGVDTSIVVFDLVQGSSSEHSGRTFQSGVSYDIYIRVDSENAALSTAGGGPGTWGTWSGTANLGSDDRIILVGDGSPVDGPTGAVTQVSFNPGSIAWQSSASGDAGRVDNSSFARTVGVSTDSTNLFGAALPSVSFVTTNVYFTDMPGGILTSQGLA